VWSSKASILPSEMYSAAGPPRFYMVNASQSLIWRENPSWRKNPGEIVPQQNRHDERRKTEDTQHLHIFFMLSLLFCSNSQSSSQFLTSIQSHCNFLTSRSLPYSWSFAIFYVLFFSHFLNKYCNFCPTFSYPAFTFLISSAVLEF
jgi:hypothetical protein